MIGDPDGEKKTGSGTWDEDRGSAFQSTLLIIVEFDTSYQRNNTVNGFPRTKNIEQKQHIQKTLKGLNKQYGSEITVYSKSKDE